MSWRRVLVALLVVAVWAALLLGLGLYLTAHQPSPTTTTSTVRR
jgi:hypothetical protein